jgi:hypothetical protein
VICFVSGVLGISMYWWPNIPSVPRPAEGRIYPLNNHAHCTCMNARKVFLKTNADLLSHNYDADFLG